MKMFKEIYTYRELLKTNVQKEIRGKYKGSMLGVLWSFANPLLQVLVYAIVFPWLLGNQIPNYLQYLIIGIIPWTFLTTVINQGIMSIRANAGIIKKVYFPREILPFSVAVAGLINFFISCLIILIFCASVGVFPSWHLIFLPLIALFQFFITLGVVLAFSAINIYIKDIEYIIQFVLNMLFYGTPILYPMSLFQNAPFFLKKIIEINPFTHIVTLYRDVFLYHNIPDVGSFIYLMIISVFCMIAGLFIFKKLEKGFAEEV